MVRRYQAQMGATTRMPCIQTRLSFVTDFTSAAAASALILNAALELATTSWSSYPRPIVSYLLIGIISNTLSARTQSYACTADRALGPAYLLLGVLKLMAAILEASRSATSSGICVEDNSGLLARFTFAWLYKTIRKGCRTRLEIRDLPATKESVRSHDSDRVREECTFALDKTSSSMLSTTSPPLTLHRKILKTFGSSAAVPITLRSLLLIVSLAQPMIIRAILKYSESPEGRHGVFLVLGVALIYTSAAFLSGAYWHAVNSDVTRLRGFLFTSIYKRALLHEKSQGDSGNGAMVSLLSSDIDAILQGFTWVHEIWATMITAAISMWMLYTEVGLAYVPPEMQPTILNDVFSSS